MNLSDYKNRKKHNIRFPMPDIPREIWCDFRVELIENHMTLTQLAEKYYCDPRTVRNCIQHNKSSYELGKKTTPSRIQIYEKDIKSLLNQCIDHIPENYSSFYKLSQYLYPLLQEKGYDGSERTLRNYLQKQPHVKALLEHRKL